MGTHAGSRSATVDHCSTGSGEVSAAASGSHRNEAGDVMDQAVMTQEFTLTLPWSRPPLTLNQRFAHWSQRSTITAEIRTTVAWLAKQAKIEPGKHLTVELVWAPGDRRRRDEDNLAPTLKAAIDALARNRADFIGLDLVPDDTAQYVTRLPIRIEPPPHPKGMWLTVNVRRGD